MNRIIPVKSLRNTQHVLTNLSLCLINGNPLCAPEASAATEYVLIQSNPKGGES